MGACSRSFAGVAVALVLVAGCARPVAGLWPPAPGVSTRGIVVSVDSWHAMIAFPLSTRDESTATAASRNARFEEWGYAERGWYLEGRQGLTGVLRAMLWPSPGLVEVVLADRLWAERTPDPPAETVRFELTEVGHSRLREHLRNTLASDEPVAVQGASRFYAARAAYHVFHTCHQYAALALREAGLPLSPGLAFSRGILIAQLRRASQMQTVPSVSR